MITKKSSKTNVCFLHFISFSIEYSGKRNPVKICCRKVLQNAPSQEKSSQHELITNVMGLVLHGYVANIF